MILPLHRLLAVAVEVTGLLGEAERPEDAGEDEAPLSFLTTSSTTLAGVWGHLRKTGEGEATVWIALFPTDTVAIYLPS